MSLQFDTAFRVLSDYFGVPKWEENPKTGQSRQEIVKVWEQELRPYTVEQVKQACYEVCRYAKSMSFPTISHIMSRLVGVQKPEETRSAMMRTQVVTGISPERELWELTGKRYIYGDVKSAFLKMVKDFKAVYPELANTDCTTLCANMRKNGYWEYRLPMYFKGK